MRVYIAGALSSREKKNREPAKVVADYIQNMSHMCQTAVDLKTMGFSPYVPGLDFLLGFKAGIWGESDYYKINLDFLTVCDAIYVISMSEGVKREIKLAEKNNIPVFYNIAELVYYKETKWAERLSEKEIPGE